MLSRPQDATHIALLTNNILHFPLFWRSRASYSLHQHLNHAISCASLSPPKHLAPTLVSAHPEHPYTPTSFLHEASLHFSTVELLHKNPPNILHLHLFRCILNTPTPRPHFYKRLPYILGVNMTPAALLHQRNREALLFDSINCCMNSLTPKQGGECLISLFWNP